MKKILLLIPSVLVFACSNEPLQKDTHNYLVEWKTDFKDNLLTVRDRKTNDTVYISKEQGIHKFELKRGHKYHINIIQNELNNSRIKHTSYSLYDVDSEEYLQRIESNDCLRNIGYYLTVN